MHNLSKIDKEVEHSKRFIKVYLLLMRLPSRYLVQRSTIEKGEEGYTKKREFKDIYAKVASRLEGIRRTAVKIASKKFYYVEELDMWIGVSENAMEVAQEISRYVVEELRRIEVLTQLKNIDLSRYGAKVIPVYLESEDAKWIFSAAIEHLFREVKELQKKIGEAQRKKKRSLRQLQKDLEYRRALLEEFRNVFKSIE